VLQHQRLLEDLDILPKAWWWLSTSFQSYDSETSFTNCSLVPV
jgi:hypothetical protein